MEWTTGDTILLREIHHGRIRVARPATLVRDAAYLVAAYLALGMRWKRPVDARTGARMRMPATAWPLQDAGWERSRWLQLIEPGVAHAIHLWWLPPDWRFGGWYVNLQEPVRRGPLGFDYMDHMLDIVIGPDLSWRWKDEDELAEAVSVGLVTQAWAAEVRREGERVFERLERRQAPFCDGWEEWQPDPAWPLPALPSGWDRL